jgi:uncharacterized YccA/Bax inhibitor family protein
MANPAFNSSAFTGMVKVGKGNQSLTTEQLDELYQRPAAGPTDTDRMSYDDVIVKTVVTLGFVLVGATVGFFFPVLYLPFMFVGFALALVNIFKKQPSAGLVLAYGAAQGIFVGGISRVVENIFPGVIYQALLGTAAVFAVTLALFASGKVRESKRATQIFLIAGSAYALFSIVNLVLQFTGVSRDPWGLFSADIMGIPLGLIIGPLAILLAAYSLVMDFTFIKNGIAQGAPRNIGWRAAFGLVLTIIWLYLELLRLISIFRE